jgi:hypothetical protein
MLARKMLHETLGIPHALLIRKPGAIYRVRRKRRAAARGVTARD